MFSCLKRKILNGILTTFAPVAVYGERVLEIQKDKNNCLWLNQRKKQNYKFPRNFGVLNWIKYYLGLPTKLKKYRAKMGGRVGTLKEK